MRLTLRWKLLLSVGTSAFAFIALIAVGIFLTGRMARQLTEIQDRYIPLIELGPRLTADFDHIARSFQDSVAAQDAATLPRAEEFKNALLLDLADSGGVVPPAQASGIRDSLKEYFDVAYRVSRRLISKETGTAIVADMTRMQRLQAQTDGLLDRAATLDRKKLVEAFSTIATAQTASGRIQVFIGAACLLIMFMLSVTLSRTILASVSGLSNGLSRFGQGDFSQPIPITTTDELADVAQVANQMAIRINGLLKELDSFSYSVAHDLRAPLRGILGLSTIIIEDFGPTLPAELRETLERVLASVKNMGQLIDSLLNFSRLARKEIKKEPVNLSSLAENVLADLRLVEPNRKVQTQVDKDIIVTGDPDLLQIVMTNLLGNAWKFTSKTSEARIEFKVETQKSAKVYVVRDNGAGFDMQHSGKLFGTFQRAHTQEEFEGTGIGLATVQRIISRHGGTIWANAKPGQGAAFYFVL